MTSTDCPKLCFQRGADYGFKGAGSGFPQLGRETLSKNAMLPGLTYFYCNSVSQAGNVLPGCESERRRRGSPPCGNRLGPDVATRPLCDQSAARKSAHGQTDCSLSSAG